MGGETTGRAGRVLLISGCVGFFCRDAEFLISVVSRTEDVESYSNGLLPKSYPSFDSVSEAIAAARAFVETLTALRQKG